MNSINCVPKKKQSRSPHHPLHINNAFAYIIPKTYLRSRSPSTIKTHSFSPHHTPISTTCSRRRSSTTPTTRLRSLQHHKNTFAFAFTTAPYPQRVCVRHSTISTKRLRLPQHHIHNTISTTRSRSPQHHIHNAYAFTTALYPQRARVHQHHTHISTTRTRSPHHTTLKRINIHKKKQKSIFH